MVERADAPPGGLRTFFDWLESRNMPDEKKQVLVVGLGRFGSAVARSLYNLGHDVLAIDHDEDRVQAMMGQVTHPVTGDASNDIVLRELGVSDYNAAVVAVGSDIVVSVMTCVLLQTMGVPYIVARAQNEPHANTLDRLGVNKVIHAEAEMGVRVAHNLFNPNVQEYMELAPNYGISRLRIPDKYVDKTLRENGFSSPRDKYGVAVLALRRGKEVILNPDSDDRLRTGDILVLAGRDDVFDEFET